MAVSEAGNERIQHTPGLCWTALRLAGFTVRMLLKLKNLKHKAVSHIHERYSAECCMVFTCAGPLIRTDLPGFFIELTLGFSSAHWRTVWKTTGRQSALSFSGIKAALHYMYFPSNLPPTHCACVRVVCV